MVDDALVTLGLKLPGLRPAEQRVARAVLDSPRLAIDSTITELAQACDTSPATVVRLCTAVGFSGYPDFRLAVAGAASRERAEQDRFSITDPELDPGDAIADTVLKVAFQEARSIEESVRGLDLEALARAAGLIEAATRVDIYGQGPSGLAGLALQQKLLRIGTVAPCWTDPHLALNSAALLTPGAVAIGISHSGTTVEVNQSLATARAAGATTIAVTNFPDSPLTGHADVVLTTTVRQMRWWSGIMSSRIAQLAVLDCLFAIVAQRRQERTGDLIARAEAAAVLRRTVSSPQPQPQP